MADALQARIVRIIESTLREESGNPRLTLCANDSMDTIVEWDSLAFMAVFRAVNDDFGIDPDFDDAIHYLSVESLHLYLAQAVR